MSEYFGHARPNRSKIYYQLAENFGCLSVCKKSSSSLKVLHNYYFEDFTHVWQRPSNMIVSTCRKLLCLSAQKFIRHFSLEILQRFSKLAILGTLGMTSHAHQNWCYRLIGKFGVSLHAKNQLHLFLLSEDITNMLQPCYFGDFDIPSYGHQNRWYQLVENFDVEHFFGL